VVAALLLWALTWTLLPVWFDSSPSSDNIEQLVWSQGLELGYHKHPPLPTWILIGAEQLFPASLPLTYALSILGMMAGGFFLWRLAAELLGESAAAPVVLATACIAFYSYRAHIYNHNTVLVPFVWASAWLFLRAARSGQTVYWVLLGAACAAGMLTKYQFAVIVATFILIAARLRLYRQPQATRGALIAVATCIVLVSPHIWWLVTHDFPPLRYASSMVLTRLGPLERIDISGGFLMQQVRDVLAPMLMLALAAWLSRRKSDDPSSGGASEDESQAVAPAQDSRVWITMLGFAPLALMLALGLAGGVRLENHWGTTGLQFVILPIMAWMRQRRNIPALSAALVMFFVLQVAEAIYVVVDDVHDRQASLDQGRIKTFDPSSLSRAVVSDWRSVTAEPLRYVVGPTTWAGFISLYSKDHPQVLISGDPSASPWVSMQQLAHCGGVYIDTVQPPRQANVTRRGEWVTVDYSNARRGLPLKISWSVVAPDAQCRSELHAGAVRTAGGRS
jgi:4-amino-4-deoxy-L-arabinose transferase-like glycosyltransferase